MEFTDSIEEMLKVYNWGDEALLKYTGLGSRREAAIKQDYNEIRTGGGNFIDPAFPHNDSVVGAPEKIFDSAQSRQKLYDLQKHGFNRRQGYSWVRMKDFVYVDLEKGLVPKDYTPVFSTGSVKESLSRTDISQGLVGNCWFLAALGAISVHPEQFEFCVPTDNEYNETGVYHFRFWFQGLYVDVVVDDYLPCFPQTRPGYGDYHETVGARPVMNGDKLEFWGPLVEKAYAKLWGSYLETVGGQISNGFENITGGFPETFDLGVDAPDDFLEVIKSCLNQSMFLGLSCHQKVQGLQSGHAYSITGHTVVNYDGEDLDLIRIRNPWGRTEWNGKWSDTDDDSWESLSTKKERDNRKPQDDGEFWMSYDDMIVYFAVAHVVTSYTLEDFKKAAGNLKVERHLGAWSISKGNASGTSDMWNNPQYPITVSGSGNELPLVVALSRERKLQRERVNSSFLVCKDRLCGSTAITDIYGREPLHGFSTGFQTYGFKVSPGKYIISPMTHQAGVERKYCLRMVYQTS